ncbi:MAG: hypothetical protein K1X83_06115 [Oligoflexia bacterium]|nr:hypothetical protein [Oligoflexia bacterium]
MISIFYDLETSERHTLGQILNYCFIAVDSEYREIARCVGDVRISVLQLPSPSAILANRVNVFEHQARARDSEREAALKILEFIDSQRNGGRNTVQLVGFNSNKFDFNFLRVTLIRNGLSQFMGWKLQHRDLLHLARKLYCQEPSFPRELCHGGAGGEELSLRLETLTQGFALLAGPQAHFSSDDVELTIALAKHFKERFGADLLTFESYEAEPAEARAERGEIVYRIEPNYADPTKGPAVLRPMGLINASSKYALWVDLERFAVSRNREAISWFTKGVAQFQLAAEAPAGAEDLKELLREAKKEFKNLTVNNFFGVSDADIEVDIFRLSMGARAALGSAIWAPQPGAKPPSRSKDEAEILRRYKIANQRWDDTVNPQAEKHLRAYALYRYGGKCKVSKYEVPGKGYEMQPSLTELLQQLRDLEQNGNEADRALLRDLRKFYYESFVYRLAGAELAPLSAQDAA